MKPGERREASNSVKQSRPLRDGTDEGRRAFLKAAGALTVAGALAPALSRSLLAPSAEALSGPTVMSLSGRPSVPPAPAVSLAPTTEWARIAHLLRRAGFGASQKEMERYLQLGLKGTVDYLIGYDALDNSALDSRLASLNLDMTKFNDLQRWWLLRMVYTARPLQEKMVLFWHGLLTSGLSRVGRPERMWVQNELFRQQALGRYDVLLKAISRDPAMLVWLDSRSNRKSAPNENFARELMELFTMGVGNYTEQDVREAARAFTGWSLNSRGFIFNAGEHDFGMKTVLEEIGPFNGDDVIDIIMRQPATAAFITRRLFRFFAYDDIEPELHRHLQRVFRLSAYNIKSVVREILLSEAFYSSKAYRSRPKSPAELVASTVRTLGLETDANGLPQLMTRMGQTLFDPPNVAGWPGGATWLNSSTILERINFMNRIVTDRQRFRPEVMLTSVGAVEPRRSLAYLLGLLVDGAMAAEEGEALEAYTDAVVTRTTFDSGMRAITYLILSSPDYQLA